MGQQVVTLTRSTGVQATFGPEGIAARFGKLFNKEIQTGDGLFDEHVHVKTDTEVSTAKLLESTDLRAIVEGIVAEGGAVEIDGTSVKIELRGRTDLEPNALEHLVAALLG